MTTLYAIGFLLGLTLFALLPSLSWQAALCCFLVASCAALYGMRGLVKYWIDEEYEDVIECELEDDND